MEERAARLGGSVARPFAPGDGTTVVLEVPHG
jgi:signal transduction histidine kinase